MNAARLSLFFAIAIMLQACVVTTIGGDRSVGRSLRDNNAALALQASFRRAHDYELGDVDIEIADGLILLTGAVPRPEDKIEAERLAWDIDRILGVANEIEIGEEGFRRNAADEHITAMVRSRILSSDDVKSINYNIETHNAVVYLMGIARSADELDLVTSIASDVKNVERVVSYVRLRGGDPEQKLVGGPDG